MSAQGMTALMLVREGRNRSTIWGTDSVIYPTLRNFLSRNGEIDTMPGKAAKVIISERQQEILEEFSRSRTEPSFLRQRSCIILLAFAGLLNEQIAPRRFGTSPSRRQSGRSRWADAFDRLVRIECLEGTSALRKAIRELLADAPRPGTFSANSLPSS